MPSFWQKLRISNRENKIDKRTLQASVELKVFIEQIREQVQNIE